MSLLLPFSHTLKVGSMLHQTQLLSHLLNAHLLSWYFVECITSCSRKGLRSPLWSQDISNFICILAPLSYFRSITAFRCMLEGWLLQKYSEKKKKKRGKSICWGENLLYCKNRQDQGDFFSNECSDKTFLNYECRCWCLLPSNPVLLISVYSQSPRVRDWAA